MEDTGAREAVRVQLKNNFPVEQHILERGKIADLVESSIYSAVEIEENAKDRFCDWNTKIIHPYISSITKKKRKKVIYPFRERYRELMWKTYHALCVHESKHQLWERINSGYVKLVDVCTMTHLELDLKKAAEIGERNQLYARSIDIRMVEINGRPVRVPFEMTYTEDGPEWVEVPDSELQCSGCMSCKISSYQQQTRSADEPMTIFANCLACGKRWRQ